MAPVKLRLFWNGLTTALEIGCGAGVLLTLLASKFRHVSFTGVEPIGPGFSQFAESLASIEAANANIIIIRSRIEDMSTDQRFDLIFSINVFEHLDDWRRAIDISISMLKPGGMLVILCPNYNIPYESHFALPIFLPSRLPNGSLRARSPALKNGWMLTASGSR